MHNGHDTTAADLGGTYPASPGWREPTTSAGRDGIRDGFARGVVQLAVRFGRTNPIEHAGGCRNAFASVDRFRSGINRDALASGAARGLRPRRAVARAVADGYLASVAGRLEPQSD